MSIVENKELIIKQGIAVVSDEKNLVTNLANLSALFNEYITDINWIGFYLKDTSNNNLVLGPFQGKVACTRIAFDKGVCGFVILKKETVYVADVHTFKGHIACDSRTISELVVPILKNDEVVCLLDIDSTTFDRFSKEEVNAISSITKEIFEYVSF